MSDLWALYTGIAIPATGGPLGFEAEVLPGRSFDYVAKDASGMPAFLVRTDASDVRRLPITLKHVAITFDAQCRVSTSGSTSVDNFALIHCSAQTEPIQKCFVRTIGASLSALPSQPTRRQVLDCIQDIAQAFQELDAIAPSTVKGLWGELLLIAHSRDPMVMLSAWRMTATDRFDFTHHNHRLDVKTSESEPRVHDFALEQLRAPAGIEIAIASLVVEQSVQGASVFDLAQRVAQAVGYAPAALAKLWRVVLGTIGDQKSDVEDQRYDVDAALSKLLLLDARSIPAPIVPLDAPIYSVRFRAEVRGHSSAIAEATASVSYWKSFLDLAR